MTLKELARLINSPTLERDLQYLNDTGDYPSGYTPDELALMEEYLLEKEVQ
jgi:hypothetical protein